MSDSDLPFIAHYKDGDKIVPRRFATNAEARDFRSTLVDGKLPVEPVKAEQKAVDAPKPAAPVPALAPSVTAPVVGLQKVDAPKGGA